MNEQKTITIPLEDFRNLIRQAERVSAVERLFDNTEYVTIEGIKAVLSIGRGGKNALL